MSENRVILVLTYDTMLGPRPPYWQPTFHHAKAFEAKLKSHLTKIKARDVANSLTDYRFQYTGIGRDKRFVVVNGFCRESWAEFPSWREKWVLVLDGGELFLRSDIRHSKE